MQALMSFALSITFTELIVSIDQTSAKRCESSAPGVQRSSTTTVQQTGTPGTNVAATAGPLSVVLFCISLLNGRIEKMLRRPQQRRWRVALHIGLIAVGLVYVAIAAALAGRSATAVGDYYEAWLLGLLLSYILDALKSLAVHHTVDRCLCCSLSSGESDDAELGGLDLASSPVVAVQPGPATTAVNEAVFAVVSSPGDEEQADHDANAGDGYLDCGSAPASPAGFTASTRKMKPEDSNERCNKCASKVAFCICNSAEARRRTMTMGNKCKYVSEQGRTCSKPAVNAKPYCIAHTCSAEGCASAKSSRAEFCPVHEDTQA